MGSPVSPLICNIYMESLEQQAIASASEEYKPTMWLRYVDDCLAVIPTGSEKALNDHINSIDQTQSIKFTYEAMEDNAIPFLDAHLMIKEDGTIGAKVYRKKTHTNQYLLFGSMHPLTHKLSVARTLLDRCQSIVTDPQDQIEEEENNRKPLQPCTRLECRRIGERK